MKEEFYNYINKQKSWSKRDKILLAVSGGIDSMVMADLFISHGFSTAIAHCNFNLRGNESDGDQEFVRRYARRKGIPFFATSFDTKTYAAQKGISIQMAARELRYSWFEEIRKENRFKYIALAHNADDNIETFLINLVRGTGIAGLTGMKTLSDHLFRPLLFATRNDIEKYSGENRIRFREDSSNADTKYARNKLRLKIIPLLKELNPSFAVSLTETMKKLGDFHDIYSGYIEVVRENLIKTSGSFKVVSLREIMKFTKARDTILFELLRPFGLAATQHKELLKLIKARTGATLNTREFKISKNRNDLIISPLESKQGIYLLINSYKEFSKIKDIIKSNRVRKTGNFRIPHDKNIACFDSERLGYPLVIRNWKKGDSFHPLGMKSAKKLSDYFTDRKISLAAKESILVMESGGRIAWVIGERIDDRFKVSDSTKTVLVLRN